MELNEPPVDYSKNYSYADYLKMVIEERFEIIKGKLFKMSPAPSRIHQEISGFLFSNLYKFLNGSKCKVYAAPFDVRLAAQNTKNEDITTVVQPDLCVVCDPKKLDDAGCFGAPDLIIEILSKSNNRKELANKFEVYEENGVLEYWIIHPEEKTITIYELTNGKFVAGRMLTEGDMATSKVLPGFNLNISNMFDSVG